MSKNRRPKVRPSKTRDGQTPRAAATRERGRLRSHSSGAPPGSPSKSWPMRPFLQRPVLSTWSCPGGNTSLRQVCEAPPPPTPAVPEELWAPLAGPLSPGSRTSTSRWPQVPATHASWGPAGRFQGVLQLLQDNPRDTWRVIQIPILIPRSPVTESGRCKGRRNTRIRGAAVSTRPFIQTRGQSGRFLLCQWESGSHIPAPCCRRGWGGGAGALIPGRGPRAL